MTSAELAILSLIAERPRHGYDIEQVIEIRGMREWTEIGFSSIYYLLKKLEKEGLVISQMQKVEGRGPARKVYHITEAGGQAHIKAVIAALSNPQQGSSPFLLGVANLPVIPRKALLEALDTYVEGLGERLQHLNSREVQQQPVPSFVGAMFDYSRVLIQAEIQWIQKFMQEVKLGHV